MLLLAFLLEYSRFVDLEYAHLENQLPNYSCHTSLLPYILSNSFTINIIPFVLFGILLFLDFTLTFLGIAFGERL